MKIISIEKLNIEDILIINFRRFCDHRGYFTESYRKSDFENENILKKNIPPSFVQHNESFSKKDSIRGLHFQWNPFMGKLVRTICGHMIDIILDIRLQSPTFGKGIMYDMPARKCDEGTWIWVPKGFAHGNCFLEDTTIEYLCTGEYSPDCESGISPFSEDIDWSMCNPDILRIFKQVAERSEYVTDKDRNGLTVDMWKNSSDSMKFTYVNK